MGDFVSATLQRLRAALRSASANDADDATAILKLAIAVRTGTGVRLDKWQVHGLMADHAMHANADDAADRYAPEVDDD